MGETDELKLTWVCEACGEPHVGVDPPDDCPKCQGRFFENLFDLVAGKDAVLD